MVLVSIICLKPLYTLRTWELIAAVPFGRSFLPVDNARVLIFQDATYDIGGPLLQDGLSPIVLAYSRISIFLNLIRSFLIPSRCPYFLCILSSAEMYLKIDRRFLLGTERLLGMIALPPALLDLELMASELDRRRNMVHKFPYF